MTSAKERVSRGMWEREKSGLCIHALYPKSYRSAETPASREEKLGPIAADSKMGGEGVGESPPCLTIWRPEKWGGETRRLSCCWRPTRHKALPQISPRWLVGRSQEV